MKKSNEEKFVLTGNGKGVISSGLFSKRSYYKKVEEIFLYFYSRDCSLTVGDIEKGLNYKFNPYQIRAAIKAAVRRREIEST